MLERLRRGRRPPIDRSVEARIETLQGRVSSLEGVIEGLQDAVYRETVRQDQRAAWLERKTEPKELARALSEDARRRGL
jgi:uncharacterized coiled-coil protein SlyX